MTKIFKITTTMLALIFLIGDSNKITLTFILTKIACILYLIAQAKITKNWR